MHNVLYISHTSQLGGAEQSLLVLLERLDRERFSPTVVVPGPGALTARLDEMNVPHSFAAMGRLQRTWNPVRLLKYSLVRREAVAQIGREIDRLGVHLVHSNSTMAHLFASPAAERRGIPVVWHLRDERLTGIGAVDAAMVCRASAIIAVSQFIKDGVTPIRGLAAKACVVHNGVDTGQFAPGERMALRSQLGLDGSTPLAGIVGQIVPWKGHERFLEAAAAASTRLPEAKFLVVGDDRFGNHPRLIGRLKEKARLLGLADRVIFTGWMDDAAAVMNALDVLVVASENEPFGRVIIEAMACGKPVVSFGCGGPVEIIEDGETGLLVRPYDVSGLADGMVRLLSDSVASERMGALGRKAVCERFSADAYAAAVQGVYGRVLGLTGRTGPTGPTGLTCGAGRAGQAV